MNTPVGSISVPGLRELSEKAPKGPWTVTVQEGVDPVNCGYPSGHVVDGDGEYVIPIPWADEANLYRFIVACVNYVRSQLPAGQGASEEGAGAWVKLVSELVERSTAAKAEGTATSQVDARYFHKAAVAIALGEGNAEAARTNLQHSEAARIKAEAERDEAADDAVDFVFKHLACALGLSAWTQEDGSETWQGDVCATLMRMLRDAKVIDPETDELAVDRAERAESELSTLKRQLEARGGVSKEAVEAFRTAYDEARVAKGYNHFVPSKEETRLALESAAPLMCGAGWKTIDSAPCDDTEALVFWRDGRMTIEDLDHDSSPEWWAKRGATHWRHKPAAPAPTAHKTERPS